MTHVVLREPLDVLQEEMNVEGVGSNESWTTEVPALPARRQQWYIPDRIRALVSLIVYDVFCIMGRSSNTS